MHAIRMRRKVNAQGRVVLPRLGVTEGTVVEVLVLAPESAVEDHKDDLAAASESSLAFWDNPADEIWDDVGAAGYSTGAGPVL